MTKAQVIQVSKPAVATHDGLRAVFAGTPGRLRTAGAAAIAACLLFGVVSFLSVNARSSAISSARKQAAQLVLVQGIRSSLTQADAAATNAFLVGGLEPADQQQSYSNGIANASAALGAANLSSPADAATLAKVNAVLTQYTGLIESARANNRQGFPIGAAYLRQASALLRSDALPQLSAVAASQQARITDAYNRSAAANTLLIVTLVLAFLVLAAIQGWLSFKTRRTVNVNLAAATVAVLVVGLIGMALMAFAQHSATNVRNGSLANTVALSTARTNAFDAKSDESLTLIARGSGQPFEDAYKVATTNASTALTGDANQSVVTPSLGALTLYEKAHTNVRAKDDVGNFDAAVALATTNVQTGTKATFAAFDATSQAALTSQASHVSNGLSSARNTLGVLALLLLLVGLISAALSWRGVAVRLREYR